jgi:YD repeat-containing protein
LWSRQQLAEATAGQVELGLGNLIANDARLPCARRRAESDPAAGAGHPTSFTFDAMSRLTGITYPDNSTASFTYDIRGRRITSTDQNGKTTTYTYDDADCLTAVTDPANNTTTRKTTCSRFSRHCPGCDISANRGSEHRRWVLCSIQRYLDFRY